MRPGPEHIGTTGATSGDTLIYNPVLDEMGFGPRIAINGVPVGGSTGQVVAKASGTDYDLTWVTALTDSTTTKGDILARTSSVLTRLAVGTDGQVLTADAASTAGVKWAAAGGSGLTIKDRQWTAAAGSSSIDEFNDSSLDAAWARVDVAGGTGRATWTEDADVLSVAAAGGDAAGELHAMMRPISGAGGSMATGDAFITACRMLGPAGTPYTMSALVLANGNTYGAGSQILALSWATTSAGVMNNDLRPWTNYSTDPGLQVSGNTTPFGPLLYIRLVFLGSNTWRRDLSPDGVTWLKGTANLTNTLVPTHVGLATTSYGTATKGIAAFELFRRVSGIT